MAAVFFRGGRRSNSDTTFKIQQWLNKEVKKLLQNINGVGFVFLLAVCSCTGLDKDLQNMSNSGSLNGPTGPAGPQGPYLDFTGEKSRLLNVKWELEAYENGKVNKSTVLEFKTQRNLVGNYILSGISAVNFYEAGYSLSGDDGIKITGLSMTEMAGSAQDMAFETHYFERLLSVTSFEFRDDKLVLRNARGQEMVFN